MSNKRTPVVIGVVLALVLLALFMIPKFTDPTRGFASAWAEAGVGCLAGGHSRTAQHFHPKLAIGVDGLQESIPANVGVLRTCMAEVHTHDASGTLHVEAIAADKITHLKDFFTVWGKTISRDGYSLVMTVDGKPNFELGELILKDGQQIVLEYKSNRQ